VRSLYFKHLICLKKSIPTAQPTRTLRAPPPPPAAGVYFLFAFGARFAICFITSISKAEKESNPCITAPRLPNFYCSLSCASLTRRLYVPPPPAAAARRCFLLTRLFFVCGIFAALFLASECRFVARSLARGFLIARRSCAARAHAGCSASTASSPNVLLRRAGCRYRRRAVVTLPLRLFVGRGCGASATTPGYSAQAHTRPRCVRVDAPILPCLRGGSQKYLRHAPRTENLSARELPLAVRACVR